MLCTEVSKACLVAAIIKCLVAKLVFDDDLSSDIDYEETMAYREKNIESKKL
jgi:hypothetical protein